MQKFTFADAMVTEASFKQGKESGKQYLLVKGNCNAGVKDADGEWASTFFQFTVHGDGIKYYCDEQGNLAVGKGTRINCDGKGYIDVWQSQDGTKMGATVMMSFPDVEIIRDHSAKSSKQAQPQQAQNQGYNAAPAPQQFAQQPAPQQYQQPAPQQYQQPAPQQFAQQPAPQQYQQPAQNFVPPQQPQVPYPTAPAGNDFMQIPQGISGSLPWQQ